MSAEWCAKVIEAVAKIERAVKNEDTSLEPISGRLFRPETSIKTHMAVRRAVAAVKALVDLLPEDAPPPDDLIESIYMDIDVPLTNRCLIRSVILDAFSHEYKMEINRDENFINYLNLDKKDENEKSKLKFTQTDIFALPVYGDPKSALNMLINKKSQARICSLIEKTGFIGQNSAAVLSVPLNVESLRRIDVLKAIMSMVDNVEDVDLNGNLTTSMKKLTPEKAIEVLEKHIPKTKGPFLIVGVRVRKTNGRAHLFRTVSTDPLAVPMPICEKITNNFMWNHNIGQIIIDSGISASDLVIRAPQAPVRAEAQAVALGLVHEIYQKLGNRPFIKMEFEHVRHKGMSSSPLMMALSAFNIFGNRITTSNPVSLFQVGLGDDFQEVLSDECSVGQYVPNSISRQQKMESFLMKNSSDGGVYFVRINLNDDKKEDFISD